MELDAHSRKINLSKLKENRKEQVIILVYLICSVLAGVIIYYGAEESRRFFQILIGAPTMGWAICAPIARIIKGEVSAVGLAVLPVTIVPLMFLAKSLPSKSPIFIIGLILHVIFSFSYMLWLLGMPFTHIFKKSTWKSLFNKSQKED